MASYITALAIQKNNSVYLSDASAYKSSTDIITSGIGVTMEVPCPDSSSGGVIDGDYWAKPVNDGVVAGFTYIPYNLGDPTAEAPDAQSFAVTRISSRFSSDDWYILGTSREYINSCAACCDTSPAVLMPTATDLPLEAGCQTLCQQDTDGNYFGVVGLPTLVGGVYVKYYPFGYFNDEALTSASVSGYTSTGTLLTFLNDNWSSVGTWSVSNGVLIVTQTDGPGTDVLCVQVVAINPSA